MVFRLLSFPWFSTFCFEFCFLYLPKNVIKFLKELSNSCEAAFLQKNNLNVMRGIGSWIKKVTVSSFRKTIIRYTQTSFMGATTSSNSNESKLKKVKKLESGNSFSTAWETAAFRRFEKFFQSRFTFVCQQSISNSTKFANFYKFRFFQQNKEARGQAKWIHSLKQTKVIVIESVLVTSMSFNTCIWF